MTADVYKRPDGDESVLVIDFRQLSGEAPLASLKSSQRYTTSSRTPGQIRHGTVWSQVSRLKRCPDCGRLCDGAVPDGEHAAHAHDGVRVNCVGGIIL